MALRGFVKCLADGHHCANIMLAAGFWARWLGAHVGGFARPPAWVLLFVGLQMAHNGCVYEQLRTLTTKLN